MLDRLVAAVRRRLPSYKLNRALKEELSRWKKGLYFPGHYYSPIVSSESLAAWTPIDYEKDVPGVDLREGDQLSLLTKISAFYDNDLFPLEKSKDFRYYFNNEYFSFSDGIFLNLLMRCFEPKAIVEVGSGYSSALMLDTNERYFKDEIELTFIEPFPEERLNALLDDDARCVVIKQFVQDVPLSVFERLSSGDIFFVDSSHTSKYRSDLNYILFEILPVLKPGVIIHFHDIFFPFEYPIEWLRQGRSWNEAYLLRAFLQYNTTFKVLLFTSFLEGKYRDWFMSHMPLCLTRHEKIQIDDEVRLMETTGQSIYLVKE